MTPKEAVDAMPQGERTALFRATMPDISAPYHGCVTPGSWLAKRLDAISNPRRRRWKAYLRACRKIPAGTPCHGSTSWDKINTRRLEIIEAMYIKEKASRREAREGPEFKALQNVASEWLCGPLVAENFCMGRWLRRARKAGFAE